MARVKCEIMRYRLSSLKFIKGASAQIDELAVAFVVWRPKSDALAVAFNVPFERKFLALTAFHRVVRDQRTTIAVLQLVFLIGIPDVVPTAVRLVWRWYVQQFGQNMGLDSPVQIALRLDTESLEVNQAAIAHYRQEIAICRKHED